MKTIVLISLLFFGLSVSSCKSKTAPLQPENNTTSKSTCRLVISFVSRASGINKKAFEDFKRYLLEEESEIKYEIKNWGREGEKDICFDLNELTAAQQNQFIERMKTKLEGKDLIRIKENSVCH